MVVPVVTSVVPVNGAVEVLITQDVILTFNTPIDEDTVHQATVFVYRTDTYDLIPGSYSVSNNVITYRPSKRFYEDVGYTIKVVGASENSPGGTIKSTDGDAFASPVLYTFTTEEKSYATLDEVMERADVTQDGPIRTEDILRPGGLALRKVTPRGFSTNLAVDLDEVQFEFSADLNPTTVDSNSAGLEVNQVLGDEDYYGGMASDGYVHFRGCEPEGVDFTQPSGNFTVTGSILTWRKGSGEPDFNYNSELVFRLTQDIEDVNGQTLLDEVMVTMTTEYFPRFIYPQILRAEMGPLLSEQFEDTLNRTILKNSIESWELAGYCFDVQAPYPAVKRWVRHKCVADLMNMISSHAQAVAGQQKVLGDLNIRYPEVRMPRVDNGLLNTAQKGMEHEKKELLYYRNQGRPVAAVKGANVDGYPAGYRRWDILYQTDNIFYDAMARYIPATNLTTLRLEKLALLRSSSSPSAYYFGTITGVTGLFICPDVG